LPAQHCFTPSSPGENEISATTLPNDLDTSGKLKIQAQFIREGPDPTGLSRWDVYAKRYLIIDLHIGTVIAGSRDEALRLAKLHYPNERRLAVSPATED
jgi:hypothetical protein